MLPHCGTGSKTVKEKERKKRVASAPTGIRSHPSIRVSVTHHARTHQKAPEDDARNHQSETPFLLASFLAKTTKPKPTHPQLFSPSLLCSPVSTSSSSLPRRPSASHGDVVVPLGGRDPGAAGRGAGEGEEARDEGDGVAVRPRRAGSQGPHPRRYRGLPRRPLPRQSQRRRRTSLSLSLSHLDPRSRLILTEMLGGDAETAGRLPGRQRQARRARVRARGRAPDRRQPQHVRTRSLPVSSS